MFVGVGEVSFLSLAALYIKDCASAGWKNRWLGLFYVYIYIPVGVALVYVFGGYVGDNSGWRSLQEKSHFRMDEIFENPSETALSTDF